MIALCIGHSTYDFIVDVESMPVENTKTNFNNVVEGGGGGAANMAYLLGKYRIDTYLSSLVGDDTYGSIIKKGLEQVGVHTEHMETSYDKKTSHSLVITNVTNKSRTIFNIEKEKMLVKKSDYMLDPDIVLSDGYDYGATVEAFNKFANKITILDAGSYNNEIMQLCKYPKYIIGSLEFAQKASGNEVNFANPQSLVTMFSNLCNKFPGKEVIITLEEKGVLYKANNQIKVMPGLQANAVDTTGAGDIFHGAFAYAILQGYDIEKAITFANIAAGLSVTKKGAWLSVPDISEVMPYFNQKYPNEIQNQTPAQPEQPDNPTPPADTL